jgi:mRNA-degrading endonuclease toxin of MazEF toxin-antitoxin module
MLKQCKLHASSGKLQCVGGRAIQIELAALAIIAPIAEERGGKIDSDRGDLWATRFGLDPAQGHEQQGRRPVLIISPEAFNRVTKVLIVLPITSGGSFARAAGFAVTLEGAGTKTTGIIRCDQPRALDLGARAGKKLESVPDAIVEEVLARVTPIFE